MYMLSSYYSARRALQLSSSSSFSMMRSLSLVSNSLVLFLLLCCFKEGHGRRQQQQQQATETIHQHTILITSLLPSSTCSPPFNKEKAASLPVVHRHGPCSQLSQDSAPTVTQLLSEDQARVNSIQSRLAISSDLSDRKTDLPAMSGRSLGTGNYIVTVGLGSPKRDLSLIFDTGSDLTWTQCQPCVRSCYEQQEPIFDPSESQSYSNVTCDAKECSELSSATGNAPGCSSGTCIYGIQYGDQSFSVGYFGREKLTVATDEFDNFYFGCGQNNRGLFGSTAGLLGLGQDSVSIVSQTAAKYGKYFSYCLPSLSSSSGGHLTFGNPGVSKNPGVRFTPLVATQGTSFYFIDITAISVGGEVIPVDASVFKKAGTIIDSGTVITRLPPSAYTPLKTAFKQQMTQYKLAPGVSILDTCFDLSGLAEVTVPTVSFTFGGDVKVDLGVTGILYPVSPSQVCLAFAGNSDDSSEGIFGNFQQQTMEVVYDVAGQKLGFAADGCS